MFYVLLISSMEAKENGTRFVVIDPVYNATASKADWWVPVKGGTDGALALGVLNVLFENGWIDEDMLRNKTNCGLLIKEDGKFLRMSDLGVEPTEGELDPATGEPTVIDPPCRLGRGIGDGCRFQRDDKPCA